MSLCRCGSRASAGAISSSLTGTIEGARRICRCMRGPGNFPNTVPESLRGHKPRLYALPLRRSEQASLRGRDKGYGMAANRSVGQPAVSVAEPQLARVADDGCARHNYLNLLLEASGCHSGRDLAD